MKKLPKLRLGFAGQLCIFGLLCMGFFTTGIYLGLRSSAGYTPDPPASIEPDSGENVTLQDLGTAADPETLPNEEAVFEYEEPVFTPLYDPGKMIWPITGKIVRNPGWYYNEELAEWRYFPGLNITSEPGMAVRAVLDGNVAGVQWDPVFGDLIVLEHGDFCRPNTVILTAKLNREPRLDKVMKLGLQQGGSFTFKLLSQEMQRIPLYILSNTISSNEISTLAYIFSVSCRERGQIGE